MNKLLLLLLLCVSACSSNNNASTTILKQKAVFKGHFNGVITISFSPDGKILASGSADNTIILWDVHSGKILATCKGHKSTVTTVDFSPDGKTLASGCYDSTINLWDVKSGKLLKSFKDHRGDITSIDFSPDGQTLVSSDTAGPESTVIIWDLAKGNIKAKDEVHFGQVASVIFSRDGRFLIVAGGVQIRIIDLKRQVAKSIFIKGSYFCSRAIICPNNKYLVWVENKGVLSHVIKYKILETNFISNVDMGKSLKLSNHPNTVFSISFSPDSKILVAAGGKRNDDSDTGIITLLGGKSFSKIIATIKGYQGLFTSVAFSPNGEIIAAGSHDGTIRLWYLPKDK